MFSFSFSITGTLSLLIILLSFYFLNVFFINKEILIDKIDSQNHKSFATKQMTPLTGGPILLLTLLFFLGSNLLILKIFLFLIFITGIFSDINFIKKPSTRFLIQLIVVFIFLYFNDYQILDLRIDIINNLLNYEYFNLFFMGFCFLILINGFNFIDGLNTLSFGYFFLVFINLLLINDLYLISVPEYFLEKFVIFIFIFIFFMIFSAKFFLGDSGSYLLGAFIGIEVVTIHQNNIEVSPWYFALLLWYPSFEILFSIFRKLIEKTSPLNPDKKRLHQLIYAKLKKKKINFANSISANLINLFNFLVLLLGTFNIYSSIINISLIFFNIFIYVFIFFKLKDLDGIRQ